MYMDVEAVGGGHGDPFFMLYFEEWRTAGHYQILEPDPRVRYNLVIAHHNWRATKHATVSTLPGESCSISLPPAATQHLPSPAIVSPALTPPPESTSASPQQLQSTWQRLESDGIVKFSDVFSPICREIPAPMEDSEVVDSSAGQ